MSSEWRTVEIGSLCLGIYDGPHATPKKTTEGPVFLGISSLNSGQLDLTSLEYLSEEDFGKWTKRVVPQAGDIVFSYETRLGQVAVIPEGLRCCLGRRMALMRVNPEKATSDYLLYAYLSPDFQDVIRQRTIHGSTVDRIPLVEFGSFPISVPPLAVQREVVATLRALDDRITLLRETNATLEAIAQALFKSWFVDFDPVRTKLEGRAPEGMDEATARLFPDSFEESELGLVPRGWFATPLTAIASVVMGLSPKGDSYNANRVGIPLVNGPVEFGDYFPVKTKWTTSADRLTSQGDLIFCVRGSTTGRRVVSDGVYCIGRGVCAIRADKGHHGFLYQTINFGLDRLLSKTTGSVFPSLSSPDIKNFLVLKPSDGVTSAYEDLMSPLLLRIQKGQIQVQTLATLRDTLLPRLISGQLRLPEAQAAFDAALA
jgi:type I restriction enzyme S subunit